VGTGASVTVFTITIKANYTFNDDATPDDLWWGSSVAFKTVYDGASIGGAQAGGTYTYTKSPGG
jgi:hypothetical protein